MTSCDNCREVTDDLKPVSIGSLVEAWCEFCVWQGAVTCCECGTLLDKGTAFHAGLGARLFYFCPPHRNRPLLAIRQEMCCQPDYDYEKGRYVHQEGCFGSVEANEEAREA